VTQKMSPPRLLAGNADIRLKDANDRNITRAKQFEDHVALFHLIRDRLIQVAGWSGRLGHIL